MSAIDYDLSRITSFAFDVDGVLSPSTIPVGADGVPRRMVNIKDGYALQLAVKLGYNIAIITGGTSEAVRLRFEALGITDIFQGAAMKLPVLRQWMDTRKIAPENLVFMGDDIPDIQALAHSGLPCSPADACTDVLARAKYISHLDGGHGCVRDVIEQVLKAQGKWLYNDKAFGW